MKLYMAAGGALLLAAVVGIAVTAGDAKSGLQPGDGCGVFEPLNVTGPFAGQKRCLVWANGPRPVVLIFAREINDPLTSLVKKVNEVNNEQGRKMGSFVVLLSDEEAAEKKLKALAEKEKLDKTVLTLDNPTGPASYKIDKSADVTVILYKNKTVKVNRTYKKGEFKAEEVDNIVKDLPKILDAK